MVIAINAGDIWKILGLSRVYLLLTGCSQGLSKILKCLKDYELLQAVSLKSHSLTLAKLAKVSLYEGTQNLKEGTGSKLKLFTIGHLEKHDDL